MSKSAVKGGVCNTPGTLKAALTAHRSDHAATPVETRGDDEAACPLSSLPPVILGHIFAHLHGPGHSSDARSLRQTCSWLKAAYDDCNTHLRLGGRGGHPAQGDPSLSNLRQHALKTKVQQVLSALVQSTPKLTSLHLPYDSPWLPWTTLMHICAPALSRIQSCTLWSDLRYNPARFLRDPQLPCLLANLYSIPSSQGTEGTDNMPPGEADRHTEQSLGGIEPDPWLAHREIPFLGPVVGAAASLTHLDSGRCPVVGEVSTLSALTSLRRLDLRRCVTLDTLEPLRALTRLAHLNILDCCSIWDASPLTACTSLTHLNMSSCQGVEVLCAPPSIVTLTAQHCSLKDIIANSGCTSLTHLDLHCCSSLTSMDALSTCSSLAYLDLYHCMNIADLSALSSCPSLTHLDLSGTEISTLPGLSSCSSLTHLALAECGGELTHINMLSGCASLTHLNLGGWRCLADTSVLLGCASLTHLNLHGCWSLADVRGLLACTSLKHLNLHRCRSLTDASALSGSASITHLDMSYCTSLTELASLSRCSSLAHLDLSGSAVSSLSAISDCSSLELLNACGCSKLTDISALSGCPALTRLDLLFCTGVTDVSALAACTSLAAACLQSCILASGRLPPCPSLSHLRIKGRCSMDLGELLAPLTALTRLDLHMARLGPRPALPPALPLQHLDLSFNADITDLDVPVSHFPKLLVLDLVACRGLTCLSGLRQCPQLHTLKLASCSGVTDFSGLSWLTALTSLDLYRNPIQDLRPLQTCTRLTGLKLGGIDCALYNAPDQVYLQPLTACHALRKLHVHAPPGCQVRGIQSVGEALLDLEVLCGDEEEEGWLT